MNYANTAVILACCARKVRSDFTKLCEKQVKQWELLHCHGISNKKKQEFVSISREPCIIGERSGLNARFSGLSAPKMCDRKTYMEAKISVILRRDFGVDISESGVGKIPDFQGLEVH